MYHLYRLEQTDLGDEAEFAFGLGDALRELVGQLVEVGQLGLACFL